MGCGGASWKFKRVAGNLFRRTCGSLCRGEARPAGVTAVDCNCSRDSANPPENQRGGVSKKASDILGSSNSNFSPRNKNLCAICLDPLNYSSGCSPGQAIFTAQCSHAFHFNCISSNVRHGSITCPICRAQWTQLPRNLHLRGSNKADPILQILDDSIANSRFHRRSFLRSARYDDDDPVDPDLTSEQPHLQFSLAGPSSSSSSSSMAGSPPGEQDFMSLDKKTCLLVRLGYQPSTDLVLVACPDEPHLRMMKHAMALVVFSLRPGDRLAIVTYSSAAARVFPLRRMTPFGKKAALQVIDRLFYIGQADPTEGLKKGVKILSDRSHKNPQSCILHLTNSLTRSNHLPAAVAMADDHFRIHRFHLGFRFGAHEFEEFLGRMLSGTIRDVQLRIKKSSGVIRIRELRGGDERRIPIGDLEFGPLHVAYSYTDGGDGGRVRMGEASVGLVEKGDRSEEAETVAARNSSGERWEHRDPFMARRWAKHLHGKP